jgi:heme-degrading monooxygenase HmoA
MAQTVTMTFFRYRGLNKVWGMMQMRNGKINMRKQPGVVFFKMLGTGSKAGYSLKPDFGGYALFCVWKDENDAAVFFNESKVFREFKAHTVKQYTIYMHCTSTRGSWSGQSPFIPAPPQPDNNFICVLTRATLKKKYLYQFWKRVPGVSKSQEGFPGLLFSKGVGEIPFFEQATFTVWKDVEHMKEFAYKSSYHSEAIKKTREMDGFKEEMFTRFQPYKTTGEWEGTDFKI